MKSTAAIVASLLAAATVSAQGATQTTMANPAATFCVENDGTYEIRTNADGSQFGVCILTDGTEVDAWDYLRAHFEH